jgi:phage tail-like protein
MRDDIRHFRNLNRDGLWPGFLLSGLELTADGRLRLLALPRLDAALPEDVGKLPCPDLAGGIAVDRDGTVFFSSPAAGCILRINVCSGETEAVPCLGGKGAAPTQFDQPAGLLIPPFRRALYVADSGNGRIQIFDLDSLQLGNLWTGFEQPVSLAADAQGNVYVVDLKTRRVDRFSISGDRAPSFWNAVAGSGRVSDPRAVAVEDDAVYVLDGQTSNVCRFHPSGALLGEIATGIPNPMGLAVVSGIVYVGDQARRRISVFRQSQAGGWVRAGDAAGYDGPVAALAPDRNGGLLVSPGSCHTPLRLTLDASSSQVGLLWSGPISVGAGEHFWNRIHATLDLPTGTHIEFFFHTGPAVPPPVLPGSADPFPAPWRAAGIDVTDFFVGGPETPCVWIGARFSNDLDASPALGQLRVEYDQQGYLAHLPAIYRGAECDDFLLRFLTLFESFFQEYESRIEGMPALFDPAAAPREYLPWLAGFLALELSETWTETQQREAVAAAYARYARRGTVAGLREALRLEAGVRAVIDEPIQAMGWWAMPAPSTSCRPGASSTWEDGAGSVLGFNTVLASAEPQGAVVGTTAVLDQSYIIAQEEFGSKLFEVAAHQFTVLVYRGEIDGLGKLDQVKAVIDREKPVHTVYRLCVIEPGPRVGYRARLGIDTVIGGGPVPGRLGEGDLVLAGRPRGALGVRSELGVTTQL